MTNDGGETTKRDDLDVEPVLQQIYGGRWAAHGIGWAIHADTREEAIEKYWQAVERHRRIAKQPYWYQVLEEARKSAQKDK